MDYNYQIHLLISKSLNVQFFYNDLEQKSSLMLTNESNDNDESSDDKKQVFEL